MKESVTILLDIFLPSKNCYVHGIKMNALFYGVNATVVESREGKLKKGIDISIMQNTLHQTTQLALSTIHYSM